MRYVDYVYDIVRIDCEGMDAIYKDYIIQMVGIYGFNALLSEKLIESCGVIHERYLYTLCKHKKSEDVSEIDELKRENQKLRDLLMKGVYCDERNY